jgi:hypothetical protein
MFTFTSQATVLSITIRGELIKKDEKKQNSIKQERQEIKSKSTRK